MPTDLVLSKVYPMVFIEFEFNHTAQMLFIKINKFPLHLMIYLC